MDKEWEKQIEVRNTKFTVGLFIVLMAVISLFITLTVMDYKTTEDFDEILKIESWVVHEDYVLIEACTVDGINYWFNVRKENGLVYYDSVSFGMNDFIRVEGKIARWNNSIDGKYLTFWPDDEEKISRVEILKSRKAGVAR